MAPITKKSVAVHATPATIWKTCFEDMQWEKWDPDLETLDDISPPGKGCVKGTKFIMVHNDNEMFVKGEITKATPEKSLTFTGDIRGVKTVSKFRLKVDDDGESSTTIKYTFDMHGFFGYFIAWYGVENLESLMEKQLANMVRLSEEAEHSV